ncbi:hypothetical protein [Umezawaea sp. Da 62-37]|uniref:hypothetical protein n=1 Tax=Umezawaea sp. Da 62-37 TaxID=3075927 RepID=UPI0028F70AD6|nr:hypothetical protein [Umezawaea sp. Da 62-37]WNV88059.1 hypothetical protein RM788_07155 [Umezawaea sp. Da 62-37]
MEKNRSLVVFSGIVTAMFSLVMVFLVLGSLVQAFFLLGGSVCFDATAGIADVKPDLQPLDGLEVEGYSTVRTMEVCVTHPSAVQRVLGFGLRAPSSFAYGGALFLLAVLLRHAERGGVHTLVVAQRVGGLGRYLLVVLPLATLVESVAQNLLLVTSTSGEAEEFGFIGDWDFPGWAIVTGLGMIALSRVMRDSAAMREDLEGTV